MVWEGNSGRTMVIRKFIRRPYQMDIVTEVKTNLCLKE